MWGKCMDSCCPHTMCIIFKYRRKIKQEMGLTCHELVAQGLTKQFSAPWSIKKQEAYLAAWAIAKANHRGMLYDYDKRGLRQ